jgi:hypothetical protein
LQLAEDRTAKAAMQVVANADRRFPAAASADVSEEERHAIAHARYQVEQASAEKPECCFDFDLVRDLLRVIDRRYPAAASADVTRNEAAWVLLHRWENIAKNGGERWLREHPLVAETEKLLNEEAVSQSPAAASADEIGEQGKVVTVSTPEELAAVLAVDDDSRCQVLPDGSVVREACQCPKCGRMHRHLGNPPASLRSPAARNDQEGWDLVAKSWQILESHSFPPEACDYLPDAIDNAITCLVDTREKLLAEVLQLRAQVERQAKALQKIADLIDAEDALEPLDDAIQIATRALSSTDSEASR